MCHSRHLGSREHLRALASIYWRRDGMRHKPAAAARLSRLARGNIPATRTGNAQLLGCAGASVGHRTIQHGRSRLSDEARPLGHC